jgi:hypothetical protein
MDLLVEADAQAKVQEAVFFAVDGAHRKSPELLSEIPHPGLLPE